VAAAKRSRKENPTGIEILRLLISVGLHMGF
jgi:hypothetical protein